jgi:hypothetical protein
MQVNHFARQPGIRHHTGERHLTGLSGAGHKVSHQARPESDIMQVVH